MCVRACVCVCACTDCRASRHDRRPAAAKQASSNTRMHICRSSAHTTTQPYKHTSTAGAQRAAKLLGHRDTTAVHARAHKSEACISNGKKGLHFYRYICTPERQHTSAHALTHIVFLRMHAVIPAHAHALQIPFPQHAHMQPCQRTNGRAQKRAQTHTKPKQMNTSTRIHMRPPGLLALQRASPALASPRAAPPAPRRSPPWQCSAATAAGLAAAPRSPAPRPRETPAGERGPHLFAAELPNAQPQLGPLAGIPVGRCRIGHFRSATLSTNHMDSHSPD